MNVALAILPEIMGQNIVNFMKKHQIKILNFGGSRTSQFPKIEKFTEQAVRIAIQKLSLKD